MRPTRTREHCYLTTTNLLNFDCMEWNGTDGTECVQTGGPATNDAISDPEAAKALAALEADMEAKKTEPQDEKEPEAEGSAKSFECQVCG